LAPSGNIVAGISWGEFRGANFVLTGDKHDGLVLNLLEGIKILTVRDFLVLHRPIA
jgi:hypothetical protein